MLVTIAAPNSLPLHIKKERERERQREGEREREAQRDKERERDSHKQPTLAREKGAKRPRETYKQIS